MLKDTEISTHQSALNVLNKLKTLNISIKSVDYNYLLFVERKLLERGCKINTVGVYFRALRSICNRAVKEKLISPDQYPFANYKIKVERVSPRNITSDQMRTLFALQLDPTTVIADQFELW